MTAVSPVSSHADCCPDSWGGMWPSVGWWGGPLVAGYAPGYYAPGYYAAAYAPLSNGCQGCQVGCASACGGSDWGSCGSACSSGCATGDCGPNGCNYETGPLTPQPDRDVPETTIPPRGRPNTQPNRPYDPARDPPRRDDDAPRFERPDVSEPNVDDGFAPRGNPDAAGGGSDRSRPPGPGRRPLPAEPVDPLDPSNGLGGASDSSSDPLSNDPLPNRDPFGDNRPGGSAPADPNGFDSNRGPGTDDSAPPVVPGRKKNDGTPKSFQPNNSSTQNDRNTIETRKPTAGPAGSSAVITNPQPAGPMPVEEDAATDAADKNQSTTPADDAKTEAPAPDSSSSAAPADSSPAQTPKQTKETEQNEPAKNKEPEPLPPTALRLDQRVTSAPVARPFGRTASSWPAVPDLPSVAKSATGPSRTPGHTHGSTTFSATRLSDRPVNAAVVKKSRLPVRESSSPIEFGRVTR
jgi:hypothetical protein